MNKKKITPEPAPTPKFLSGVYSGKSYVKNGVNFYTFKISVENLDRDNEIVNIDGLNFDNFLSNPVVFFNHKSYDDLPIGTAINLKRIDNFITADISFHGLPDDDGKLFSSTIDAYVSNGILNTVSIGFLSLKGSFIPVPIDSLQMQLPNKRTVTLPADRIEKIRKNGIYYHELTELLEISIVNIPANAGASQIKALELLKGIKEIKSGRVLASRNLEKISNAIALLNEVLSDAEPIDTASEPIENNYEPDNVKSIDDALNEHTDIIKSYLDTEIQRLYDLILDIKHVKSETIDDVDIPEPDEPETPDASESDVTPDDEPTDAEINETITDVITENSDVITDDDETDIYASIPTIQIDDLRNLL